MIERQISNFCLKNAEWYPAVSVTGPRQSGKSTLVKSLFPKYSYVDLEDDRQYSIVKADPAGYIFEHPTKMIIDEAQRIPELFRAIKVVSDKSGESGSYILSGSQNFLLLKQITQSLAGRVGLVRLLPLSYSEVVSNGGVDMTPDGFMLKGGYPRLYDADIPPEVYFENYIATYVERDVAGYIDASNKAKFRDFLGLCAQVCGNLLNVSRLASDVGVSRATADAWLSILEASYVIFKLQPYHTNVRKRITKTPKLYFHDTGLLCHMLGINSPAQLTDSPMRGAVFENLIIEETAKRHINAGHVPKLYFYRDDSKIEVDLVDATFASEIELVEIKSTQTFDSKFLQHLNSVGSLLGVDEERRHLVMRGCETGIVDGVKVWPSESWLLR